MPEEMNRDEERVRRLVAMGQMAATLAHEIRNPLGSMELFCTLLKKDLSSQPESLNLAEQIHSGIKTLDQIISNCLQFARDSVPRRKEIPDVSKFLGEIVTFLQPRAESLGISLTIEAYGGGSVMLDKHQIKQALMNLVLNAMDAVDQQKDRLTNGRGESFKPAVQVISDLTDPAVWRLAIADNGIGISDEDQQKIFEPFFSTKSEGTGLGLAIVLSIIVAHQGKISVSSKENAGTTVALEIPRQVKE